jgi:hypothetical protein
VAHPDHTKDISADFLPAPVYLLRFEKHSFPESCNPGNDVPTNQSFPGHFENGYGNRTLHPCRMWDRPRRKRDHVAWTSPFAESSDFSGSSLQVFFTEAMNT